MEQYDPTKNYQLYVRDLTGRKLMEQRLSGASEILELTNLAKGSYLFIIVENNDQLAREILIKQ